MEWVELSSDTLTFYDSAHGAKVIKKFNVLTVNFNSPLLGVMVDIFEGSKSMV